MVLKRHGQQLRIKAAKTDGKLQENVSKMDANSHWVKDSNIKITECRLNFTETDQDKE